MKSKIDRYIYTHVYIKIYIYLINIGKSSLLLIQNWLYLSITYLHSREASKSHTVGLYVDRAVVTEAAIIT